MPQTALVHPSSYSNSAHVHATALVAAGVRPPSEAPARIFNHPMINPLRSEREAFRFLLYVAATVAAIVVLVVVLRAVL